MPIKQIKSPKTDPKPPSKLYRSETNKVIAGVCGGLAEYFGIEAVIIRILLVAITLFGGSGLLLYIILWIVMPSSSATGKTSEEYIRDNVEELKERSSDIAGKEPKTVLGIILVVIGVSLLLENFGFFAFRYIWRLWPLVIVILGISMLARKK